MTAVDAKLGFDGLRRGLVIGPASDDLLERLHGPHRRPGRGPYDVIAAFCPDGRALDRHARTLPARLAPRGVLWLAWPKRASQVPTDIGENDVRQAGLATGLVDNKIASIDEVWSGLRFAHRRPSP